MTLISDNINNVRVFELPIGIHSNGDFEASPRTALVIWQASYDDKLYQLYVNRKFSGTTIETSHRQMIVHIPISPGGPVQIEVFAVEIDDADTDFSGELDFLTGQNSRVKITLLRNQNLPIDSTIQIYSDNGTGEIDYGEPVTNHPIQVWPCYQDKAGFGQSGFGLSDFGFDSAAAIGFGKGSFGNGQFGIDADVIEWQSEPLSVGTYKFAVIVFDKNGNQSSVNQTEEITVIPQATPPEELSISSFDAGTNQLILSVA